MEKIYETNKTTNPNISKLNIDGTKKKKKENKFSIDGR